MNLKSFISKSQFLMYEMFIKSQTLLANKGMILLLICTRI